MKKITSLRKALSPAKGLIFCMMALVMTACEGDRAVTLSDLNPGGETLQGSWESSANTGYTFGGTSGVDAANANTSSANASGTNTSGADSSNANAPGAYVSDTDPGSLPGASPEERSTVLVYVCGSVVSPGVYELEDGSRVCDALEAAGGFSEGADENRINLAAGVRDGEMIFFPMVGEDIPEGATTDLATTEYAQAAGQHGLININTADIALLCTLPGIGETRANAIIRSREEHGGFRDITEIRNVSGIGESLYSNIADLICT